MLFCCLTAKKFNMIIFYEIVWFALNFTYWSELLSIHNYITLVLAMCLLEMATWYGDYMSLNSAGTRYRLPFVLGKYIFYVIVERGDIIECFSVKRVSNSLICPMQEISQLRSPYLDSIAFLV